ncbi:MAG: hypothetical protein QXT50_01095 [Thermofilum sp.]
MSEFEKNLRRIREEEKRKKEERDRIAAYLIQRELEYDRIRETVLRSGIVNDLTPVDKQKVAFGIHEVDPIFRDYLKRKYGIYK